MAEQHVEYLTCVAGLSDEEAAWFGQQLTYDRKLAGMVGLLDCPGYEPGLSRAPAWSIDKEEAAGGLVSKVWLQSDEPGSVVYLAHLVQKFLRKFRPDQQWAFSYAVDQNAQKLGEFGGGDVVVSAAGVEVRDALAQLRGRVKTKGLTPMPSNDSKGKQAELPIKSELGDTLRYMAALCGAAGLSLSDVAAYNIEKTQQIHADGTLSQEDTGR